MSRNADLSCKVYVGDLPNDASEKEIEKEFSYYGVLKSTWVARNPPGFAFVEFEDPRDADDAIQGLDGRNVCGVKVRVEPCSGKKRAKPWERESRGPPRYNDGGGYGGGGGGRGGRGASASGGRRGFDPSDECYKCGKTGHYAYDCSSGGGGRGRGGGGRGRDRSVSPDRGRYGRSRSRSRDRRYNRSYSRERGGRSGSRSPRD